MRMHREGMLVALSLPAGSGVAAAQEHAIARSALPAAVERTIAARSQGATIRGFSQEREKGQTYYEAEMMVGGHHRDLLVDTSGAVVEVEEEVALASLPAAVRSGLEAKAGRGRITRVESLTKHDRLVAYEAVVVKAGKRSEIQVGPDGKPLAHEE
jgi:hypothetical protein